MMVRSFLLFANSQTDLKDSGQNPPANSSSLNVQILVTKNKILVRDKPSDRRLISGDQIIVRDRSDKLLITEDKICVRDRSDRLLISRDKIIMRDRSDRLLIT